MSKIKEMKIGQTVQLRHKTDLNEDINRANIGDHKSGNISDTSMIALISKGKLNAVKKNQFSISKIKRVYMNGKVQTTSGDIWKIAPCQDGAADWQTVLD